MRLALRLLLVLSLAVNVGLVGVGIYRAVADTRAWGPEPPELGGEDDLPELGQPPNEPGGPPTAIDTPLEAPPAPAAERSAAHADHRRLDGAPPAWERGARGHAGPAVWAAQRWPQRRLGRLDRALHLTHEQHQKLEAQLLPLHGDIQAISGQLARARGLLMVQLAGDRVDADAARALQARISRAQARLDSLVTEAMLREHDVLDARQRLIHSRMLRALVAERSAAAPPFDSPAPMDHGNQNDDDEEDR